MPVAGQSHVQDGKERMIAYARCTSTKKDQRYCETKSELYAIVHFIKQLKWLSGGPLSREDLRKGQTGDPFVSWLLDSKEKGTKPAWKEEALCRIGSKSYCGQWEKLQICHRLLCQIKRCDGKKQTEEDQEDGYGFMSLCHRR